MICSILGTVVHSIVSIKSSLLIFFYFFLAEKNIGNFCTAKALHNFLVKNGNILGSNMFADFNILN